MTIGLIPYFTIAQDSPAPMTDVVTPYVPYPGQYADGCWSGCSGRNLPPIKGYPGRACSIHMRPGQKREARSLGSIKRDLDRYDALLKSTWLEYRRHFEERSEPAPWYCPNSGNGYSMMNTDGTFFTVGASVISHFGPHRHDAWARCPTCDVACEALPAGHPPLPRPWEAVGSACVWHPDGKTWAVNQCTRGEGHSGPHRTYCGSEYPC